MLFRSTFTLKIFKGENKIAAFNSDLYWRANFNYSNKIFKMKNGGPLNIIIPKIIILRLSDDYYSEKF